jgi:hypothetical protein
MLKSLTLALLLCAAFLPVRGQSVAPPPVGTASAGAYQFCMVVMTGGNRMLLDYGQDERDAVPNPELARDDAKIRKTVSLATALTYMSSHGWEYLSANSVTTNSLPTGGSEITYGWFTYYLLRRRL